jgi:hypothetical protein
MIAGIGRFAGVQVRTSSAGAWRVVDAAVSFG